MSDKVICKFGLLFYGIIVADWLRLCPCQGPQAPYFLTLQMYLLRLVCTHADTNCPRADCVSPWTMVLIGMGVSYGVGTRVFVQ